jgi:Domain of unknown function (DUF222)
MELAPFEVRDEPLPQLFLPSVLDAQAFPDDTAAWAARVGPGAAVIPPLAVLDPTALSQPARVDVLISVERQIAWLQARQLQVLAAMAADPMSPSVVPELDREWVKEEVRAALGESAVGADIRLGLARELTRRLPETLAALARGEITLRHARCLVEAVAFLDDETAASVQAKALPFAAGRDLAAFRRKVAREVLAADPRSALERHADQLADRRVGIDAQTDGMASLYGLLPAEGAAALMTVLDERAARREPGDERTSDQRRADALVQLALDARNGRPDCPKCSPTAGTSPGRHTSATRPPGSPGGSTSPRWRSMHPTVHVTVALSTLLGFDEAPAELGAHGPIPAELARRIAADESGTWRRLVTDDLGRLIDYGRRTYRPPADLARFVMARDRTCRFPTCNRRACCCELDHATAWADGGPTSAANLNGLCCRHHHAKHDASWRLKRRADGGIEWTSPTGHSYVVLPATYPVDTTLSAAGDTTSPPAEEHPATDTDPDPPRRTARGAA